MAQVDVSEIVDPDLPTAVFRRYAPNIGAAASRYSLAVYQHSRLSLRELEAARYRTALINGCTVCRSFRGGRDLIGYLEANSLNADDGPATRGPVPDEEFYAKIPIWRAASSFSERERIAIELAERMGEAPQSLQGDDQFWIRVHAHFDDAEIVDMTLSISSWIALGRAVHVLELDLFCLPSMGSRAA